MAVDDSGQVSLGQKFNEHLHDAPMMLKMAIGSLVRNGDANLEGSADSAGRAGLRSGKVSELTVLGKLLPGGAARLRRMLKFAAGNMGGAQRIATLHDMRFVLLDDDTRVLFATAYDGDWDSYIDDFASKIPELMDFIFSSFEDWPGIASPSIKDYIASRQITATGWFVANPNLTVVDIRRLQRTEHALTEFLDTLSEVQSLDEITKAALHKLTAKVSRPTGVSY